MRLIDADALYNKTCLFGEKATQNNPMAECVEAVPWDAIENAPTIDAEPVKRGKWVVTWKCHNYHEMDSGDYAYQYSECMVHVTCSICGSDSGSFKWDKSGKGKAGIDGLAYKMQVAEMNALKTKFCPHCGALMRD